MPIIAETKLAIECSFRGGNPLESIVAFAVDVRTTHAGSIPSLSFTAILKRCLQPI